MKGDWYGSRPNKPINSTDPTGLVMDYANGGSGTYWGAKEDRPVNDSRVTPDEGPEQGPTEPVIPLPDINPKLDVEQKKGVLQHKDLQGLDRLKAELIDCFIFAFKTGAGGEFEFNFLGTKIRVSADAGSLETTQDKFGKRSENTAGFAVEVDILDFGSIGAFYEKNNTASKSDFFLDNIKNAWAGTTSKGLIGNLNIKGSGLSGSETDDLIIGFSGQLGMVVQYN